MIKKRQALLFKGLIMLVCILVWTSCNDKKTEAPDTILVNGNIYTVDESMPHASALAIKGDRIVQLGTNDEIKALAGEHTQVIDLKGQFAMPGFIEGHGHFSGLGYSLMYLNFLKAKNWDEIVKAVAERAKTAKPGEWILGRGWHQEKWDKSPDRQVLGYPYHDELSAVAPNNPVMLSHASGHALFANAKAMELAGITAETPNPTGGEIVRDSRGNAIGVFEERAMGAIREAYESYLSTLSAEEQQQQWLKGIALAEEECIKKGITSFQDAGSSFEELRSYRQMAESQQLDLRLWAMVRHSYDEMKDKLKEYPVVDVGNHFFTCRAIKSELDGALGSYGAWLLAPYDDKPGFTGQNTTPVSELENIARLANEHNMQLCVHAIGDKANREVLNVFEKAAGSNNADRRWRIEHAQHLDPADIPRFKQLGVIAAMQGIHCTSDAPFVVKRLGEERSKKGAYPWRSLLDAGAVVANGTDAPVEDVDPLQSLYATVTRKRADTGLEFYPEQRMTRQEGIKSYTLSNAYAAFEEKDKGSLAPGKLADIVVLSNDLSNCPDEAILTTRIIMTMIGGKIKYSK